jgi:hypothetical protein
MATLPLARSARSESGGICERAKEAHDDTTVGFALRTLRPIFHDLASHFGLLMPPRFTCGAPRALQPQRTFHFRNRLHRRFASTSADAPEIYDVVCVGGGPAGLSLLAALKASPVTSGLRVALIEGQDLQKNRLPKDASLESFSNRCSSLTPASVKNLQGMS